MDNESSQHIIPPLHNVMISKIFENMEAAEAAKSLINAVFSDAGRELVEEITSLRCEDTYMGRNVKGRSCRLDVIAKTRIQIINVEVLRYNEKHMIDRSLFYGGAIVHDSLRQSQHFSELPVVSLINLLEKQILRPSHPDYHQPILLTYAKGEHEAASSKLFIHNLEMAKFDENFFDKGHALSRWMYFLKAGYNFPEAALTREVLRMDAGLLQFAEKYNVSMQDPSVQMRYTQFHLAEMDYNTDMYESREKGRAEGREEAAVESLQYMKRMGMPDPALHNYAREHGISAEQFQQIILNASPTAKKKPPRNTNPIG